MSGLTIAAAAVPSQEPATVIRLASAKAGSIAAIAMVWTADCAAHHNQRCRVSRPARIIQPGTARALTRRRAVRYDRRLFALVAAARPTERETISGPGLRPDRQSVVSSPAGLPLVVQRAIEQVIGLFALGPGALPQVALPPHGQPFQHGDRRRIPRVAAGRDPVLPPGEQVAHQQPHRLGGIAGT